MSLEFELVLPCYNEAKSIEACLQRAIKAAREAGFDSSQFQLVLVENGSSDDSSIILDSLKSTELGAWFRKVTVTVNDGYGNGIWQGLKTSTAPFLGWSHADQQCDPADAFVALSILKKQEKLKTLVKGSRQGRNWKDAAISRVFEGIATLVLRTPLFEINAQPKVFPRILLKEIHTPPKDFAFDLYVLYRARRSKFQFHTVIVNFPPRLHGLSNWASSFRSRIKTILKMFAYIFRLSVKGHT